MKKPLSHIAATMHKGGLHESLHIPQGEKIPAARIEAATHSHNERTKRQAILAQTFAHHRPGNVTAHHQPEDAYAHRY